MEVRHAALFERSADGPSTLTLSPLRAFFPFPTGEGRDDVAVERVRMGRVVPICLTAPPSHAGAGTSVDDDTNGLAHAGRLLEP
jgi:hypothetical protein